MSRLGCRRDDGPGRYPERGLCGAGVGQARSSKANALFKRAKIALEAGDAEQGYRLVSQAATYFQHPAIFLLKAKSLRLLGKVADAQLVLRSIKTRKLPKRLKTAYNEEKQALEDFRKSAGQLKLRVRPYTAQISANRITATGGMMRWFRAGTIAVKFSAPGYQTRVEQVKLRAGETESLSIQLQLAVGALTVDVAGGLKGVELLLDGKPMKVLSAESAGDRTSAEVQAGEHKLTCRKGKKVEEHTFKLAVKQRLTVRCTELGGGVFTLRNTLGWGGVAAGAAMLGYGAWGLQSYFADVERAEDNGLLVDSNKHYGGALYVVSGLAVGVTSYLLFVRKPKPDGADTAGVQSALEPLAVRREAAWGSY